MTIKLFSRRDARAQQVTRRLPAIEAAYTAVSAADAAETIERLQRLRYGTRVDRS